VAYLASPIYLALRSGQQEEQVIAANKVQSLMFDLNRNRGQLSRDMHVVHLMQALGPYRARLELAIV